MQVTSVVRERSADGLETLNIVCIEKFDEAKSAFPARHTGRRSLRPNRKELPTKYRLISPGSGGIKPANDNTVAVYLDDSDCFTRVDKGPIGYDIDILVSEFDLSSRSQR